MSTRTKNERGGHGNQRFHRILGRWERNRNVSRAEKTADRVPAGDGADTAHPGRSDAVRALQKMGARWAATSGPQLGREGGTSWTEAGSSSPPASRWYPKAPVARRLEEPSPEKWVPSSADDSATLHGAAPVRDPGPARETHAEVRTAPCS